MSKTRGLACRFVHFFSVQSIGKRLTTWRSTKGVRSGRYRMVKVARAPGPRQRRDLAGVQVERYEERLIVARQQCYPHHRGSPFTSQGRQVAERQDLRRCSAPLQVVPVPHDIRDQCPVPARLGDSQAQVAVHPVAGSQVGAERHLAELVDLGVAGVAPAEVCGAEKLEHSGLYAVS